MAGALALGTTWSWHRSDYGTRPAHQEPVCYQICQVTRLGSLLMMEMSRIDCFRLVPTFAQQSPTELATAVEGSRNRCVRPWRWARSRRTERVQKKRLYITPPLYYQICSVLPLSLILLAHGWLHGVGILCEYLMEKEKTWVIDGSMWHVIISWKQAMLCFSPTPKDGWTGQQWKDILLEDGPTRKGDLEKTYTKTWW